MVLKRLRDNEYLDKVEEIRKFKLPMSNTTFRKLDLYVDTVIKELERAMESTTFNDIRSTNISSIRGRVALQLSNDEPFHGYDSKVVAYKDIEFMLEHFKWIKWRLPTFRLYK